MIKLIRGHANNLGGELRVQGWRPWANLTLERKRKEIKFARFLRIIKAPHCPSSSAGL